MEVVERATATTDQLVKTLDILGRRIGDVPVKDRHGVVEKMNSIAGLIVIRARVSTIYSAAEALRGAGGA